MSDRWQPALRKWSRHPAAVFTVAVLLLLVHCASDARRARPARSRGRSATQAREWRDALRGWRAAGDWRRRAQGRQARLSLPIRSRIPSDTAWSNSTASTRSCAAGSSVEPDDQVKRLASRADASSCQFHRYAARLAEFDGCAAGLVDEVDKRSSVRAAAQQSALDLMTEALAMEKGEEGSIETKRRNAAIRRRTRRDELRLPARLGFW